MALFHDGEREIVRAIGALVDSNPFLPERVQLERRILGNGFLEATVVWHAEGETTALNPNTARLREVVERLGTELQQRVADGTKATPAELVDYHGLMLYRLYQRYEDDWYELIGAADSAVTSPPRASWYSRFAHDARDFLDVPGAPPSDLGHLFALGFQARRAFHHIFRQIFGGSLPAARLRATVWQSIFTHDMRRYRQSLYDRMTDIPTLIIGESGTGKELVARAIALSRYIPFDVRTQTFAAAPGAGFTAVNLSALSPTLIESELFGHRRGAFTGAAQDRIGWLEACGAHGAVFLDEIGELDPAIQVKLLRVMQTRQFQRTGETMPRHFAGKVIAATNRDLEAEITAGRFREDLYYRICADLITMPTLREQLADNPGDLQNLLRIVAARIASAADAEHLAHEVHVWVNKHLGPQYTWPGNMRELEQCLRSILIRGVYRPRRLARNGAEPLTLLSGIEMTAEELVQCYCATVYAATGSYQETARRLGLDRRTVQARVTAWSDRKRDADAEQD